MIARKRYTKVTTNVQHTERENMHTQRVRPTRTDWFAPIIPTELNRMKCELCICGWSRVLHQLWQHDDRHITTRSGDITSTDKHTPHTPHTRTRASTHRSKMTIQAAVIVVNCFRTAHHLLPNTRTLINLYVCHCCCCDCFFFSFFLLATTHSLSLEI